MATMHRQALAWEARSSRRRRALLGAELRTVSGVRRANILNLSTGGALLDAAIPPQTGEPLTLARGAFSAQGRVTWVRDHRFGVSFDHAADESEVKAVTARPTE